MAELIQEGATQARLLHLKDSIRHSVRQANFLCLQSPIQEANRQANLKHVHQWFSTGVPRNAWVPRALTKGSAAGLQ